MLIEPRAILLVKAFNMIGKPVAQKTQEGADLDPFAVLNAMGRMEHLRQQALVLGAMFGRAGKTGLFHEPLFAGEMHSREFDQPVQQLAHLFAATPTHNRQPQLVHGIHMDAVLIVHSLNSDSTGVVPG